MEVEESDWDTQMDLNRKAPFHRSGSGQGNEGTTQRSIINITSNVSVVGLPGQVMYCICKGGLTQMTKAMAIDLVDYNIRVNAIGPGLTKLS